MEVLRNNHLQILTDKSRDLFDKIGEIIGEEEYTICCHCSNHGRYCVVVNNTSDEREKQRMIAIRDCVQDFHTLLASLQARQSSQKRRRDEALSRLEESVTHLKERINRCSERGRKLGVLEELITFLDFWNFKENLMEEDKADEENESSRVSSFLVNATKFAFEFVVAFAGIYSMILLCNNRHHRRKQVAAALERSRTDNSNVSLVNLDVWRGRG
ncbi:hypothetical protein F511_25247 [Dorcoceras hygrometricum]|uniref:Uncharacterized protein n=1 Tax=Dorcoceras hygrometricum TaxID=472368 RepID=A0A2Z7BTY5_9LAMI|nr:hypothetical protein F511_25247 [Dorcoceras hygrometricum]